MNQISINYQRRLNTINLHQIQQIKGFFQFPRKSINFDHYPESDLIWSNILHHSILVTLNAQIEVFFTSTAV